MNEIYTTCDGCTFAQHKGGSQIGCKLGRLDKYRDQKVAMELVDTDYGEAYKISGRVCAAKRAIDSPWHQTYKADVEQVRKELIPKVHIVVLCGTTSLEQIEVTAKSVGLQTLDPKNTHFITDGQRKYNLRDALEGSMRGLAFNVRSVIEKNCSKERMADIAVKHIPRDQCMYYILVEAGVVLPESLVADIDRRINDELEQLMFEETKEYLIVHRSFHDLCSGSDVGEDDSGAIVVGLVNKAKVIKDKQNCNSIIKLRA